MFGPGIAISASAASANSARVDGAGIVRSLPAFTASPHLCGLVRGDPSLAGRQHMREGMALAALRAVGLVVAPAASGSAGGAQADRGRGPAGDAQRGRQGRDGEGRAAVAAGLSRAQRRRGRAQGGGRRGLDAGQPDVRAVPHPDQFRAKYAPTDATIKTVKQWLKAEGLKVTGVEASGRYIAASGDGGRRRGGVRGHAARLHEGRRHVPGADRDADRPRRDRRRRAGRRAASRPPRG